MKKNETNNLSSKHMTISQLAERAGLNLQTIRYYESLDLIPEPERSESGYRLYDESYLEHIKFVKNAQDLSFSLEEIKKLVNLKFSKSSLGDDVKLIISSKVSELENKIQSLEQMKSYMEGLLNSCSGEMPTSDCPIIKSLEQGQSHSCCNH